MKEQIEALHNLVLTAEILPFKQLKAGALLPASQGVPTPHCLNTSFLPIGSELLKQVPNFPCLVHFCVKSKKKAEPKADFKVDANDMIHTNDLIANLVLNHYFYIFEQFSGDEFLMLENGCKHTKRADEDLSIELYTIPLQSGGFTNLVVYHYLENGKINGGFWNMFSTMPEHQTKNGEEASEFSLFKFDPKSNLN